MANIFSRVLGKLFGRKERQDIEQSEYQRQQAQQAAKQAKLAAQRAAQAQREEQMRAKQARQRQEQANKEAAKNRGGSIQERSARDAAERERKQAQQAEQRALEQERRWRDERARQERNARDAQQKAEQELIRVEQLRAKAREALLRTRANISDEEYEKVFKGPRPRRRVYENVKTGEGDLPGKKEFLNLGVPYSAFASSNVEILQFDPLTGDLYVCYIKGRWYKYTGVGSKIAGSMYVDPSKGTDVWDELRVRGTLKGNRFRTEKGVQPPTYLPLESTDTSAGMFGAHGGF